MRQKIVAGAKSFQTTATIHDLDRELVGQLLCGSADALPPELADATRMFYDDPKVKDLVAQIQEGYTHRFLNDLVNPDVSVGEALHAVSPSKQVLVPEDFVALKDRIRRVDDIWPHEDVMAEKVREHPPSTSKVPDPDVDIEQVNSTLDDLNREVARRFNRFTLEEGSEPLAEYDDFFTAQADTSTFREEWIRRREGTGEHPNEPTDPPTTEHGPTPTERGPLVAVVVLAVVVAAVVVVVVVVVEEVRGFATRAFRREATRAAAPAQGQAVQAGAGSAAPGLRSHGRRPPPRGSPPWRAGRW